MVNAMPDRCGRSVTGVRGVFVNGNGEGWLEGGGRRKLKRENVGTDRISGVPSFDIYRVWSFGPLKEFYVN